VDGTPHIQMVHRFPNGPVHSADGSLRWPLEAITIGVDHGLRLCAELAPEGIRSVAVDGWAVDYVRIDAERKPLAPPFCYRDERNVESMQKLHERISPERLRSITGLQLQQINTLYQLYADRLAKAPAGNCWLNLPEYLLAHWGGKAVAEYTMATHTQMVQLETNSWSREILHEAGIDLGSMPKLVPPGTRLGHIHGDVTALPALQNTELIAPACHDTASAIAGIPASGNDWGYISIGTWSLVGTLVDRACNGPLASVEQFTNLGGVGDRLLFQKNMNGMWLLKQCMDQWAASGHPWEIGDLVAAAELAPRPEALLDIDDPELLKTGDMPSRINVQRRAKGYKEMDESAANAPAIASLIFHSLAARYASLFARIEQLTLKKLSRIFVVGGGSRNSFLLRLTAEATGKQIFADSPESSIVGNFAVQLSALELDLPGNTEEFGVATSSWAAILSKHGSF
jgi:rhamnulokinase